ncbi:splicing factor suppressor of white-apricot homolog [Prunus yedoensis var. nudiflora]|uniref:Splicing factor suppressor of white-apricot homolog n=1 Tax=Prunus yedoensis var. nudiflora TaxID=2094558 RepID=A0A314UKE8_PRUYE|nr:splicing factor suppressor of white-apricot homolog [Prunus yedoensis var. nudiflora]
MDLEVVGRHALFFDDDASASFVNSRDALVEWNSLFIDRYDVRHLLPGPLPPITRRRHLTRSSSSPPPQPDPLSSSSSIRSGTSICRRRLKNQNKIQVMIQNGQMLVAIILLASHMETQMSSLSRRIMILSRRIMILRLFFNQPFQCRKA